MKSNVKYIIIDPVEGVFLGTAKNEDVNFMDGDTNDNRLIAMFSENNMLDATKAVGFWDEREAKNYIRAYLRKRCPEAYVVPIKDDTFGPYVDTVSIVKAGYGEHVWEMIDALPMISQLDH
jgi:hypothetical protein|tara:strand:+ start:1547 stop:1909 length:363 start_codon:yes stop_codon:yes gene_type:complete